MENVPDVVVFHFRDHGNGFPAQIKKPTRERSLTDRHNRAYTGSAVHTPPAGESLFCVTTPEAGIGSFAGKHVLAEFGEVPPELLDDAEWLPAMLRTALTRSGATVQQVIAHRFAPQGVTVLAMLAESHASLHTYPELGAAFVDVFTCGHTADPELAVQRIATALTAGSVHTRTIPRGAAPTTTTTRLRSSYE